MARRRLIWHIGLADAPRDVVGTFLEAHHAQHAGVGLQVAATPDEADLATREVLGGDRTVGAWARICRRVWRHRGTSMLSTPDIWVADREHVRFALDQLIGIEVHLVLTVEPGHDVQDVTARWGWTLRPERVHVVETPVLAHARS